MAGKKSKKPIKKKSKKPREIKLSMEFNPGRKKYEPVIPIIKKGKPVKLKPDWKYLWPIIIFIIIVLGFVIFSS